MRKAGLGAQRVSAVAESGLAATEARAQAPGRAWARTRGILPVGEGSAGPGRVGGGPRCWVRPQAAAGTAGAGAAPPPSLCLSCHLLAVSLKGAEGLQGHTTMLRSGRHQGVQLTPGAPSQRQCLWPWCLWPALRTKERTRTGVLSAAWRLFLRPHLKCTALGKQIPPSSELAAQPRWEGHSRSGHEERRRWPREEQGRQQKWQGPWPCDDRQEAGPHGWGGRRVGGGPGRGLSVTGSSALLWSVMVVGSFEGF